MATLALECTYGKLITLGQFNYRQVTHRVESEEELFERVTKGSHAATQRPRVYDYVDCPNGSLHTVPDVVTARVRARVTAINGLKWT